MSFICNITGQSFDLEDNLKNREGGSMFGLIVVLEQYVMFFVKYFMKNVKSCVI